MRRTLRGLAIAVPACLVAASIAGATATAAPSRTIAVTSAADSGAGTLRAAIESANARNGATIQIKDSIDTITLTTGLVYTGKGALRIEGEGATVTAGEGSPFTLLTTTGGGALTLEDLTLSNAGLFGLRVQVPDTITGNDRDRSEDQGKDASNQVVVLDGVTVAGSELHGVYIDDCRGTDAPAEQCATDAPGSAAGIDLALIDTTVDGNGFVDVKDFDGVRVDERGKGSIELRLDGSTITGNSGDGIELDESDEGGVRATTGEGSGDRDKGGDGSVTSFIGNGDQSAQDPTDPEDGFDIDERGVDGILVDLRNVVSTGNKEDNLDLNESGDGNLTVRLKDVEANGGGKRGIDLEEAGIGDLDASLRDVTATGNVDDSIRAQDYDGDEPESQDGDVKVSFENVDASGSLTKQNLDIDELGNGNLIVKANRLTANASVKDNGVDLAADGAGTLKADFVNLSAINNKKLGMKAVATLGATGTINVTDAVMTGNTPTAFNTDPNVTIVKTNVVE